MKSRMPLLIVKAKSVTRADIQRAARLAGVCIVECTEPEGARYAEPPLGVAPDRHAAACMALVDYIVTTTPNPGCTSVTFDRGRLVERLVRLLMPPALAPAGDPPASRVEG